MNLQIQENNEEINSPVHGQEMNLPVQEQNEEEMDSPLQENEEEMNFQFESRMDKNRSC